jgi:chemotaxis response regulator CheB
MQGLPRGIQKKKLNNYGDEDMAKQEKLVIIGGSAGGPSAAARAKRVNPDLEVTMFEQGRFVSYGS